MFAGPFILLHAAVMDSVRLVQILLIKKTDKKVEDNSENTDIIQKDKKILFKEVLETMKIIRDLVKVQMSVNPTGKEIKRRKAVVDISSIIKKMLKVEQGASFTDHVDHIHSDQFIIRKDLLVHAWKKYRPTDIHSNLLMKPRPVSNSKLFGHKLVKKIVD